MGGGDGLHRRPPGQLYRQKAALDVWAAAPAHGHALDRRVRRRYRGRDFGAVCRTEQFVQNGAHSRPAASCRKQRPGGPKPDFAEAKRGGGAAGGPRRRGRAGRRSEGGGGAKDAGRRDRAACRDENDFRTEPGGAGRKPHHPCPAAGGAGGGADPSCFGAARSRLHPRRSAFRPEAGASGPVGRPCRQTAGVGGGNGSRSGEQKRAEARRQAGHAERGNGAAGITQPGAGKPAASLAGPERDLSA